MDYEFISDEIFSTFLVNSEIRKKIKKIKKTKKKFDSKKQNEILSKLDFSLTNDQIKPSSRLENKNYFIRGTLVYE